MVEEVFVHKKLISIEFPLTVQQGIEHYEARLLPLPNEQLIAIVRNITQRKRMEEQLRFLSNLHNTTGFYNRAYFKQEMIRLEDEPELPVTMIIFDVDGLKIVNDTLGHKAGDQLLIKAAAILNESLLNGDILARIGGDEFAIILPLNDPVVVQGICRRIRMPSRSGTTRTGGWH